MKQLCIQLTRFTVGHEEVQGDDDNEGDESSNHINQEHDHQAKDATNKTHPRVIIL